MTSPRRSHKRRICLLPLMAFVGCALVGPEFKRPPAPIAAKWTEAADKADVNTQYADYREWWTVFSDADLARLVGFAYQHNLSLRAAGVRVLEARAQLGIAIGEFYPQQQVASASLTYNRIPGSLPYRLNTNTYWADAFGAQAGWELDFWGKLRRAKEPTSASSYGADGAGRNNGRTSA